MKSLDIGSCNNAVEYLGSSAGGDVFPEGQPANDGNPGIGIFADALENADNIGGGCFELSSSVGRLRTGQI
jgi:hypothetical protein